MVTKMLLEWEIRGKEDARLEPGVFLDVQDGWEEGVKGDFSFCNLCTFVDGTDTSCGELS